MSDRKAIHQRRSAVARDVNTALRRINAQLVLLSDTVARRAGIHPTDLQCLDLLRMAGPITASTLAARVGLTTGAITAVLDRLERAGLVRRERVAEDRRRVMVHVIPATLKSIEALYKPLGEEMLHVDNTFSDAELATVLEYLNRTLDACARHITRLQRPTPRPLKERRAGAAAASAAQHLAAARK